MDEGQDASASNGSSDEVVKLLVSSDGKLKVSWCDTLHPKIFRCITCCPLTVKDESHRENLPASSKTSATRYSKIADVYTAALAPMRRLRCVLSLRYR